MQSICANSPISSSPSDNHPKDEAGEWPGPQRCFPHLHNSPSQFHVIIDGALYAHRSRRERQSAFLNRKMHVLPGRREGMSRLPCKIPTNRLASHPKQADTPLREKTANKSFIKVRDHFGHSPVSKKDLCLSVTGCSITQRSPRSCPLVRQSPGSTMQFYSQAQIHLKDP